MIRVPHLHSNQPQRSQHLQFFFNCPAWGGTARTMKMNIGWVRVRKEGEKGEGGVVMRSDNFDYI